MTIEAMKQALEALEHGLQYVVIHSANKYRKEYEQSITSLRQAIAEAEKQPTGPATSADRYFYEAGFEAGRQQGMKQERALWELARIGQEIEAEAEAEKQNQGEHVAWYIREKGVVTMDIEWAAQHQDECEPLYTHPQPKAEQGENK